MSYVLTNTGLCNTGRLGAQGLYNISTPVSDPQPGDLVFFSDYGYAASHVGIYVGDGQFIHASSSSSNGYCVCVSSLTSGYYDSHYAGARRF